MGNCRECGFDLAGLAKGPGRCPECGQGYIDPNAWRCMPLPRLGSLLAITCAPAVMIASAFVVLRSQVAGVLWIGMTALGLVMAIGLSRTLSRMIARDCFAARERAQRELGLRALIVAINIAILAVGSLFVYA